MTTRSNHNNELQNLLTNHSGEQLQSASPKTTAVVGNPNPRRVSETDIDTSKHGGGDASVLSEDDNTSLSSSSDSSTAASELLSKEEGQGMATSPSLSDDGSVARSTTSESSSEVAVAKKKKASETDNIENYSYKQLFEMWHTDRVAKRRYPSVSAFPSLPKAETQCCFSHDNTVDGGYSFGPYFDRWYKAQQTRFNKIHKDASAAYDHDSTTTRKRPTEAAYLTPGGGGSNNKRSKTELAGLSASSIQQQRNLNSLHKWNAANALFRSEIVQLPPSFQPGPFSVIMGRRLKAPGCLYLRSVTDEYAADYMRAADSMEKSRIVTHILKEMYSLCPVGAFVRCKGGTYYEVEDLIAREKIVSELIAGGLQQG